MRKSVLMIPTVASALLLGMTSNPALAQRGGGAEPPTTQAPTVPRGDLDRAQDRLCERDGACDYDGEPDRDRLRDRDTTGDQDRDRDGLQTSQRVDDQLVTQSLLTNEERARFHAEMRNAASAEERSRIRAEHQRTIEERARALGIEPPPGAGSALGYRARAGYLLMTMLTEQERAQFMNRMRSAQSAQERQRIRSEMQSLARERARESGIDVPDWYGRGAGSQ